jgi:2-aminoadipate transaminase
VVIRYADRMQFLKASEIREMLKLTEEPDVISFAGGLPAPELFPVEQLKEVVVEVLDKSGQAALQYSTTEGFNPLRRQIAEIVARRGVKNLDYKQILITNGSQQGLDFSGKVFINPGDVVICESPTYLAAVSAFRAYQANFVEVGMDEEGMIMEELEQALAAHPDAKFIYTIPDFQNPTGRTMSLQRRHRLIELANQYDIPVVEDNPYGELRFEGEDMPAIMSLDTEGRVIYLGTFSKTFAPGLRIGWVVANPEILQKFVIVKQGADLQANSMVQRDAALFLEKFGLQEHVEKIKDVYRRRRDLMVQSIKEYFPPEVKSTYPQGGLFLWVGIREDLDTKEVFQEAIKEKVAFVPGHSFFPNGGHKNFMRINFSNMPEDRIVEGIKRLGKVLYKYYQK